MEQDVHMIARIAVAAAAALIGAWALVRFAYMPCRCNAEVSALTVATEVVERTASDYERTVRTRRNLRELGPLREACPTEVRVPLLIGANHELAGRFEDALRSYREALTVQERPEIYIAMATMQIQTGRVDEAIESYVTAARFAPHLARMIVSPEVQRRVTERLGNP
jgi:tetratricopeptide (TPR) repeat protein